MSRRFWTFGAVAAIVLAVFWTAAARAEPPVPLRSRHNEPAHTPAPAMVTVTPQGRVFHTPACTFIHGPAQMISGQDAVATGYSPCIRCMKVSPAVRE